MSDLSAKQRQLLDSISQLESCVIAFSGGVDSAVVAKAAQMALGDKAIAVTGVSASLASGELEEAVEVAKQIGIRHEVLRTDELSQAAYTRNAPDRCYHCKSELYGRLTDSLANWNVRWILSGTNADDLGDYRPGLQAASENKVRAPLAECGFTKRDVRELANVWGLSIADKPATPCLSSRIAYGEEVTTERLTQIDQAEQVLRGLGLSEVRVRWHKGEMARLEVPLAALPRLVSEPVRGDLIREFRALGFKYVTLDLEGFRSGSLNQLVQLGGG
jgi:uncharacterized protein